MKNILIFSLVLLSFITKAVVITSFKQQNLLVNDDLISVSFKLIEQSDLLKAAYKYRNDKEKAENYIDLSKGDGIKISVDILRAFDEILINDQYLNELSIEQLGGLISWIDYLQLPIELKQRLENYKLILYLKDLLVKISLLLEEQLINDKEVSDIINEFNLILHSLTITDKKRFIIDIKDTIDNNILNFILYKYLINHEEKLLFKQRLLEYKVIDKSNKEYGIIQFLTINNNKAIIGYIGHSSNIIQIRNLENGDVIDTFQFPKDQDIHNLKILPNGNIVSIDKNCIKIWKYNELIQTIENESSILKFTITSNGNIICAFNTMIKIFNGETGQLIKSFEINSTFKFLTSNQEQIIAIGYDQIIKIWDISTGKLIKSSAIMGVEYDNFNILPDGNLIFIRRLKEAHIIDITTFDLIKTLKIPYNESIWNINILENGNILIGSRRHLNIFNHNGELITTIRNPHDAIENLEIASNIIVSGTFCFRIWNLKENPKLKSDPISIIMYWE